MILLQLSAGQGPLECCKAVGLALARLERECRRQGVAFTVLEASSGELSGCYRSVLVQLDGKGASALGGSGRG